jgi:hypothetical protein
MPFSWRTCFASVILSVGGILAVEAAEPAAPGYRIELETIHSGYDGAYCWVHPRAGIVPSTSGPPTVVLTLQRLWLKGSDVFDPLCDMRSDDLGQTWSGPTEHVAAFGARRESADVTVLPSDFWPTWHAASGQLLGIGHTVHYEEKDGVRKVMKDAPRQTVYSAYDPIRKSWAPWKALVMPDPVKFRSAGAGCAQRVDLPNGDILLPIYFYPNHQEASLVVVLRCRFDGKTLRVVEVGNDIAVPSGHAAVRGMGEPALARLGGRFYLTLRNDLAGYVAVSDDGLHFDTPRTWTWDDGTDLGNYNTQQHWVTHQGRLYLVYTRKGAHNDHVFRHRAPLFIAEVDPQRLVVRRATERILVPERGARLGNFGVTEVTPNETWVTVAEWMQTWGPDYIMPVKNRYGSDNRIYVARLLWDPSNHRSP